MKFKYSTKIMCLVEDCQLYQDGYCNSDEIIINTGKDCGTFMEKVR